MECNLGVGFDDTFNNQGKWNEWLDVKKFYFKGGKCLKIYKTLIKPHIEHFTHALVPVSIHGNCSAILRLENIEISVIKS